MTWTTSLAAALPGCALALGLLAAPMPAAAQQQKTLKVVMHADVRTLDPFWTTQTIAGIHGMMIYDTLFSSDDKLEPKPQMVESWTVSDDRRTYRFTLREGLRFHDGSPVTTRDVIASLQRWGKRDGAGRELMAQTQGLEAIDARTFAWNLSAPYGLLLDTLAKSGTSVPFIMREKEALVDPFQQIQEAVGSGPFAFKRDEWVPGSKTVYVRFNDYVPRKEPPSGHAGGKVAKVDRVEFVWMPDPQTAQAALIAGEIDFLENPLPDFLPMLARTPGVKLDTHPAMGTAGIIQFNHLHPPFNDVRARQAMLHVVHMPDFLNTIAADPQLQTVCYSFFGCGVAMETDAGSEAYRAPKDFRKAEALFRAAGYKGEKITILHATDHQYINPANLVLIQQMRDAKFLNLDVQAMDWGTVVTRRAKKEPPAQGGWNIFFTSGAGVSSADPFTNPASTACEKAWFGWPCDAEIERLRDAWTREAEPKKQRQILEEVHRQLYEKAIWFTYGQWFPKTAFRSNLSGVHNSSVRYFWNIKKS